MAKPPGDPSQGASSSIASKSSPAEKPAPGDVKDSATSTSTGPLARAKRRVVVLYNCDFDVAVPTALDLIDDRSAVKRAANQVRDAVEEFGYEAIIEGVFGHDVARCLDRLHELAPDLVFNLTESLNQDSRNEIVVPAILDMLNIPFTGSGALGLGLCLHKPKAKDMLRARGVPTPASCVLERARDAAGVD